MIAAWETVRIGDLGKVVTGKTPSSERPDEFGDAYPFITPSDIDRTTKFAKTERYLSDAGASSLRGALLPPGAICVVCIGATIGKVVMTDRPSFTNQQINSVIVDRSRFNPSYVFYLCNAITDTFQILAGGAATPIINKSVFSSIKVRAPELVIQQKIAAALCSLDELIANNQRRIALLESMAEDIYREWFVRMRFPGMESVTFEKGMPTDWTHEPVLDAFKFYGGATPSKENPRFWVDGEVNWYTPTDITGSSSPYLEESGDKCTEEGLQNCSANLFPAHSIMMTSRATIGAIGINCTPACTNQGFITCIPNQRYPLTYLYHWLKLAKPHFEMLSGGSTFAELTKGTFKRIRILTPPKRLVEAYEQQARPMFDQVESLTKANRRLRATRDALLPRLISGKLRVDALDIQFPPSMQQSLAVAPQCAARSS